MEMNVIILGVLIVLAIILIVFLMKQNEKDKKDLTEFLNKEDKTTNENDPEFDDDNKEY